MKKAGHSDTGPVREKTSLIGRPVPGSAGRRHTGPLRIVVVVAAALMLLGCGSEIGDACENNQDCPSGSYCATSMLDGMCTISPCRPGNCPSGSICVEFANGETYCMATCTEDGDCRDGYSCISGLSPQPFCSVKKK